MQAPMNMHKRTHACIQTWTYACTNAHMLAQTRVPMPSDMGTGKHKRTHAHMQARMHRHKCTHACMQTRAQAYTSAHMHTCRHECTGTNARTHAGRHGRMHAQRRASGTTAERIEPPRSCRATPVLSPPTPTPSSAFSSSHCVSTHTNTNTHTHTHKQTRTHTHTNTVTHVQAHPLLVSPRLTASARPWRKCHVGEGRRGRAERRAFARVQS